MIEIKFNSDEKFDKLISTNLHAYNRNKCEWIKENTEVKPSKDKYYNYGVYENNELIGGAAGTIRFGWYFLEELWVDEKYRGKNIGSTLIEKVEDGLNILYDAGDYRTRKLITSLDEIDNWINTL